MRGWIYAALFAASVSCSDFNTAPDADAGGANAGADAPGSGPVTGTLAPPPAGCDANAEPKDSPACVVDGYGVFVDPVNGADTNVGTRAAPMKSVNAAIGARAGKPRVYICEGQADEHVKLTSAVSLFGGFRCGSWSYSGVRPTFAPSDAGYALEISAAIGSLAVSDVAMQSAPGAPGAPSSVAAFINASPGAVLRRVKLSAGQGLDGTPGADATTGVSTPDVFGFGANGNLGGLAKTCTCSTGGVSKGGHGGDAGSVGGASGEIAMAVPSPIPTADGAGQTAMDCKAAGVDAHHGSDAPMAKSASTPALGSITGDGWRPGNGTAGDNGIPGQGGGGGGGASAASGVAGGGGGGACGGCGGSGGGGGTAGGGSVALLLLDSPVKIFASELTSGAGGAGGVGKPGAPGQSGGFRSPASFPGCGGGPGGTGGGGGAGSGGAGGLSVGVLFKGSAPDVAGNTISTSAAGSKGVGGATPTNDGPEAPSVETLEIQ